MARRVLHLHIFISCGALTAAGCQRATLSVSDAFIMQGMKTRLEARVERIAGSNRMTGVTGLPVRFFVHEQFLGEAKTDGMGAAACTCDLPADATHYRAEARLGNELLKMDGLVFAFPRDRTVIVCDIDETISMTHYRELVFDREDMASRPLPDAAATLNELAGRFGLVYLTARPGFLLEKTKRWLETNGFPRAAVITTPSLAQSIAVQGFKAQRIAHLRSTLGTVAIGIGNAATDSEAYAMQQLLTLIIDDHDDMKFRSHAIILRNWKMARAFFDANREILEVPAKLQAAIDSEQMLLRPVIKYQRQG